MSNIKTAATSGTEEMHLDEAGWPTMARMRKSKRWLIANPEKHPFYADGSARRGTLDSPHDVARLVSYDEAKAAIALRCGWSLGFALGPDESGEHWQGIDLDKVRANALADLANTVPGYVELSPSGEGAHAIGFGRSFPPLGSNGSGIEAYAAGRYFTVTERPIRDGGLTCLAAHVEKVLAPRHGGARARAANEIEQVPVASQLVKDLRSALFHMRSDDRDLWVRMGQALRELGETGRELWLTWSATSEKFDPKDAARCWNSFSADRTSYHAVFAEAQRQGWTNPGTCSDDPAVEHGRQIADALLAAFDAAKPQHETGEELLARLSVDWMDAGGAEVPDIITGLVADEDVTLLGGHGGAGKSFLSLQMACAVALGEEILGHPTRQCRVLYYSAEDGRKRLTRRLRSLAELYDYDLDLLKKNLRVLDASELEPLYGEGEGGRRFAILGPRADFHNLTKMVEAHDAQFVIIDGASDTFDGNEIARREVRGFIKLLRRVHPRRAVGVLLNVHIDRSSARGNSSNDDGYAGSAAWHNSCRRRLYLQVKMDKDEEGQPIAEGFVLRIMKNQDGPPQPDMELIRGQHGLWQIAATFGGTLGPQAQTDHRELLLRLIGEANDAGKSISTSLAPQASTGIFATLKHHPEWPRSLTRKKVDALVRQLERDGELVSEEYKRPNRARDHRWVLPRSLDLSGYDPTQSAQSGTE